MNKDITTKRILIYLAVTFIITYLFEFFVMFNNIDDAITAIRKWKETSGVK